MTTFTEKATYRVFQRSTYTDTRFPGVTNTLASVDNEGDICSGSVLTTRNSDPNWRVKIASKVNASLPYKKTLCGVDVPLITCETKTQGVGWTIIGRNSMRYAGPTPTVFPSSDAAVADIALSKLKKKLASHRGDMNAMIPAVELRELRTTISGTAALVTDLLGALINIRKTKGRSAYKYASQAWLTYGFGISPLIQDAKSSCASIAEFLLRSDHVAKLTGDSSNDWVSRIVENGITGAYGASVTSSANIRHSLSYRYSGAFNFTLKSSSNYGAMQHFKIGLPGLIPTLWELTAFSWVADYFANVGDYLEDIFIVDPTKILYLNCSRKYRAEGKNSLRHVASPGTEIISKRDAVANWYYSEFERTVLPVLPHRILRIKSLDEIGGKHALNKMLNLAAVLVNMRH